MFCAILVVAIRPGSTANEKDDADPVSVSQASGILFQSRFKKATGRGKREYLKRVLWFGRAECQAGNKMLSLEIIRLHAGLRVIELSLGERSVH